MSIMVPHMIISGITSLVVCVIGIEVFKSSNAGLYLYFGFVYEWL